jgi:predicted GTPase
MSVWRIVVVAVLIGGPVLALAGLGAYHLWMQPWGWLFWWGFLLVMATGYLLAAHWTRQKQLLPSPEPTPPMFWTEQDKRAWELVKTRAEQSDKLDRAQLTQMPFYMVTAQQMADEITRFYHPNAKDPIGSVTVPELLAVLELAFGDMWELVDRTVPGGNLLTVDQWRKAKEWGDWAAKVGSNLSNAYYALAGLFDPVNMGLRYVASRLGISTPLAALQQDLTLWFYKAFVARVGTYLIELQSGRLRVGAKRYREELARHGFRGIGSDPATPTESEPATITIALVGQVKAGKSSLINALLGEQRALTSVLPSTDGVYRYELALPGVPTKLVLLDTVGYGNEGPKADQVRSTQEAIRQADVVLLVENARNAAREADRVMLATLEAWFGSHPELRKPAFVGVQTHVDLLSPSLEWDPPYDWQQPTTTKEKNIAAALKAAGEALKPYLSAVVPVRTDAGKEYNVQDGLLPLILAQLDEAHAVGLLRTLRKEADAGQAMKVLGQLREVGKTLWSYFRERWL